MELTLPKSARKCTFLVPILSELGVTPEDRFGVSLNDINAFRYKLTHLVRNKQLVRPKWEVEWQTAEQSEHARKFLIQVLTNKVIVIHCCKNYNGLIQNSKTISFLGNYSKYVHQDGNKTDTSSMEISHEETPGSRGL